jgi:hypothetical protein
MSFQSDVATQDSMGINGLTLNTGTFAQTGTFCALQVVTTAVFASITGATGSTVTGTWTGTTIPSGTIIVGRFTTYTLVSGTVIHYHAQ